MKVIDTNHFLDVCLTEAKEELEETEQKPFECSYPSVDNECNKSETNFSPDATNTVENTPVILMDYDGEPGGVKEEPTYVDIDHQSGIQLYTCPECKYQAQVKYNLVKHIKRCHKHLCEINMDFTCPCCHSKFHGLTSYHKHCLLEHSDKLPKVTCDICFKELSSTKSLLIHKKVTHEMYRINCKHCGKALTSKQGLIQHIHNAHSSNKSLQFGGDKYQPSRNRKCETCEKTFSSTQGLQDHIVVHHTGNYPHLCDICGKGFTVKEFKNRFEKHRKTCEANGPKIVIEKVCKECDKTFKTLSQFKRHMVFHTKAKAFQCSDCDKEYADKRNLIKHVLLLHPHNAAQFDREKNKPCDLCDERFALKSEVALHKVQAHGEPYFTHCETCGKGFIKNDDILRALRNHKKKCPS